MRHLAELGVVFLLFNIGLELSLERLRSMQKYVFGMGTAQVGLIAGICKISHPHIYSLVAGDLSVWCLNTTGKVCDCGQTVTYQLSVKGMLGCEAYWQAQLGPSLVQYTLLQ